MTSEQNFLSLRFKKVSGLGVRKDLEGKQELCKSYRIFGWKNRELSSKEYIILWYAQGDRILDAFRESPEKYRSSKMSLTHPRVAGMPWNRVCLDRQLHKMFCTWQTNSICLKTSGKWEWERTVSNTWKFLPKQKSVTCSPDWLKAVRPKKLQLWENWQVATEERFNLLTDYRYIQQI